MSNSVKISEKIAAYEANPEPFFSFEYFPPRTDDGVANLYKRLDRMKNQGTSEPDLDAFFWLRGVALNPVALNPSLGLNSICRSRFAASDVWSPILQLSLALSRPMILSQRLTHTPRFSPQSPFSPISPGVPVAPPLS
jgi:hypothetical protein